jgi:uncharacterized protein
MPLEVALRAVDFYHRHSARSQEATVTFYGGEALLEFEKIRKVIGHARILFAGKKQIYIIGTNGTLIDDDFVDFFLKNQDVYLNVTIDGPGSVHDGYRVFPDERGSLETILGNLRRIAEKSEKAYMERVAFLCTLHGPACEIPQAKTFFDTSDLLRDHRLTITSLSDDDADGFIMQMIAEKRSLDDGSVYRDLFRNYIRLLEERHRQGEKRAQAPSFIEELFEKPLVTIHRRKMSAIYDRAFFLGVCVPFVRKVFVNSDGTFNICEKVNRIGDFGNVFRGFDIPKILALLSDFREGHKKRCPSCWLNRLCPSCWRDCFTPEGFDYARMNDHCEKLRNSMLRALVQYCEIREADSSLLDHMYEYEVRRSR